METKPDINLDGVDLTTPAPTTPETTPVKPEEKLSSPQPVVTKVLKPLLPSLFNNNLDRFRNLTRDYPSNDLFINYNFYFMISACLARKVWLNRIYPNLYVINVGPPGVGKSLAARDCTNILSDLEQTFFDGSKQEFFIKKLVKLAPDAITFEKLVLRAASNTQIIPWPNGPVKTYHHASTTFSLAEEMGMLFTDNTKRVVTFLTQGWDCSNIETDTIKHGEIKIRDICINFLGCTVPETMKDLVRTKILDCGFTGRALFIYSEKKRKIVPRIVIDDTQLNEIEHLKKHLRSLCMLPPTALSYTKEAEVWIDEWTMENHDKRLNDHPKLRDYYARKSHQLQKLAISHHFADSLTPIIDVPNLIAAEKLLLSAEPYMHKALAGSGSNDNYSLSEEIKTYLREKGPTSRNRIVIDFYANAANGMSSIDEVMAMLMNTGQIEDIGGNKIQLKGKTI